MSYRLQLPHSPHSDFRQVLFAPRAAQERVVEEHGHGQWADAGRGRGVIMLADLAERPRNRRRPTRALGRGDS